MLDEHHDQRFLLCCIFCVGNTVSPLKAFTEGAVGQKRKIQENNATLIVFKIPAATKAEKDRPTFLAMAGDLYNVKDYIKESIRFEQNVNGITIPVPHDALPAKYASREFTAQCVSSMDHKLRDLKDFILADMEVS